jgi:hypothetical protein
MKHVKTLGSAGMAALSLMAFLGVNSVSATELTSPNGTKLGVGTVIDLSAETTLTHTAGFASLTCTESTTKGTITSAGGVEATKPVAIAMETTTFGNCSNIHVKVLRQGTLAIHTAGSGNGTVTSSGTEITYSPLQGTSPTCTYVTNNTILGTLTGSSATGGTATLDLNVSMTKTASSGFLCANPAKWEGSYRLTTPDSLYID